MTRADFYKIFVGFMLTSCAGLLSWIAITLKEVPVRVEQNAKEHAQIHEDIMLLRQLISEEARLREGRDESIQRQISKMNDRWFDELIDH